jgi:hypothetical protein
MSLVSHFARTLVVLLFLTASVQTTPVRGTSDPTGAGLYQEVTTVGGTSLWYPKGPSSTTRYSVKDTATAPTLVYNCHFMPFICRNIDEYMARPAHMRLPLAWNNGRMKLHFDMRSGTNDRRPAVCKSTGWDTSSYSRNNYPEDFDFAAAGLRVFSSAFPGGITAGTAGADHKTVPGTTLNGVSVPSGLLWSCDEFPCNRWVLGNAAALSS